MLTLCRTTTLGGRWSCRGRVAITCHGIRYGMAAQDCTANGGPNLRGETPKTTWPSIDLDIVDCGAFCHCSACLVFFVSRTSASVAASAPCVDQKVNHLSF